MGRRPLAAFLVLIGGLVAGCQPAASPGQSIAESAAPGAGGSGSGPAFTLTSAAFVEGADIPAVHSCDGAELSPPLAWSGAPDGTVAYALIVHDPDANGYIHWVVGNIGGTMASLPEGYSTELPEAAAQGVNGTESIGWLGMCPPSGTHSYVFTLYALSEPADVLLGVNATALLDAIDGKVLDQAVLIGTYTR